MHPVDTRMKKEVRRPTVNVQIDHPAVVPTPPTRDRQELDNRFGPTFIFSSFPCLISVTYRLYHVYSSGHLFD